MSRRAPAAATRVELDVPFHDVDALRIVWHGHYLKYLEIARSALLRERGLDVADVVALGYRMVVVESRLRHAWPLAYNDRARVSAWVADADHRIRVRYEVLNLTAGRRAAHGHTDLAITTHEGALLLEVPGAIRRKLVR